MAELKPPAGIDSAVTRVSLRAARVEIISLTIAEISGASDISYPL
jgi:hypothetical protein